MTGDAHITIGLSYRLCPTIVGRIIREITQVIWNCLVEKGYINAPRSIREWLQDSVELTGQWDFSHCIGEIDRKHVNKQEPVISGSTYFDYKKKLLA